ncbi:MAG: hypothetical protein J7L52_02940 [Thermotogae bacterium]|nr:hypothetical protein [Thermotogota bacterium]
MYMGVDIGTSSTKAVVVDETGKIIAEGLSSPYPVDMPYPAWAQQEAHVWVKGFEEAVKRCVKNLGDKKEAIRALCISGLYGGTGIPLDENMSPIHPALIWMDKRATEETEYLKKTIGWEEIFELTGNYIDPYYGFTKLLWLKRNHPDVWKATRIFLTPKDYIIYLLTGEKVIDHSSAGNIGGIYDVRRRRWSEKAMDILEIDRDKFPEKLVSSSEIVEEISDVWAARLELPRKTPVVAGGIDAAVATLAAGVTSEGEHAAMVGTSMCWGTIHENKSLNWRMINFPYVFKGAVYIYSFAGATTSGALIEWFKTLTNIEDLEKITEAAEKVPAGSKNLVILPFFMGERAPLWNPDLRGCIHGLTLSHGVNELFRAILEAIAFSLCHSMKTAKDTSLELKPALRIVGGLTKNRLWLRIVAAMSKKTVLVLPTSLDAPYGDAFLAALATKAVDENGIKNWISWESIEPDPSLAEEYEKVLEKYERILKNYLKWNI